MQATEIFEKNWEAIHAKNPDGTRKYRYIINTGSSRSSKTGSIIGCCDLYAQENKNKRITVWRDTKTDCVDTVLNDILRYFELWPPYPRIFRTVKSYFRYPSKSTLEIHGTDDEVKVMGLNKAVCWLNEPYKISKSTFDQLDQRTEDFVIIDWNPKQSHWVEDLSKDPRAVVIHSTIADNPFCPPEQKHKVFSYQPVSRCAIVTQKLLTEAEARAYDLANNPAGFTNKQIKELARCRANEDKKSANDFNWQVYGLGLKGERPNRIFKWTEISDEVYKALEVPRYYAVDWGSVDPWGILEFKYYDGALFLHELNYTSENEIREKLSVSELSQINGNEEGEGIVTWMFRKLGVDPNCDVVCDTNRISKITALRNAGYVACLAHKPPGSIIDGIDLLNNIPVFYTASSVNIAYEQENYSRKVDRYGVVLEEPEDTDNHLMDPARYGAFHLQRLGIINRV